MAAILPFLTRCLTVNHRIRDDTFTGASSRCGDSKMLLHPGILYYDLFIFWADDRLTPDEQGPEADEGGKAPPVMKLLLSGKHSKDLDIVVLKQFTGEFYLEIFNQKRLLFELIVHVTGIPLRPD